MYRSIDNRVTAITPIVRDMRATAKEMGITTALLDCLLFVRDKDTIPALETLAEALEALGISPEQIAAHKRT